MNDETTTPIERLMDLALDLERSHPDPYDSRYQLDQLARELEGYAIVPADELARLRALAAKVDGCTDELPLRLGRVRRRGFEGSIATASGLLDWLKTPEVEA